MEKTIKKLDEIISNKISQLQEKGIIYLMVIIAVAIAIFIIYDRDNDDSKIFSSITRCIRRFMVLLSDIASDFISILSSLTEILNLIRILVFGKIDSQTQIFLANYAIIFMSVVSYFTTMSGLMLVLGQWQAVLASFGIQVGILVFSGRLSQLFANQFPNNEKNRYVYRIKEAESVCSCNNGQMECSKVLIKGNRTKQEVETNTPISNRSILLSEWVGIPLILLLLMMCSSFFSYTAFWEKFVLPGVPLNEYINARVNISEAEEEYSKSLKKYQQQLEDILHRVNNTVLEVIDVNSIKLLEPQIQKINNDIENLNLQIEEKTNELSNYNDDSTEMHVIEDEVEELKSQLEQLQESRNNLEEQQYSSYEYIINESISCLDSFYADPLNKDISHVDIESYWGDLHSAISHIEEGNALFKPEQKVNLDAILNNYLELCRYYRNNGFAGFKMNELTSLDFQEMETNEITNEEYEQATKRMLQQAIGSLESAPSFMTVDAIWNDGVIAETSKTKLLEKLYSTYRNSSDHVQPTEKAIKSLISLFLLFKVDQPITQTNTGIVFFVFLLAIFIDCTIVFISIWKGNKNTNRSFSELRRLVGILFIQREQGRDEETRRMQLSVAFGLLFGVLMFVLQQLIPSIDLKPDNKVYWLFFMYCACGLLAAIVIGKAIGRTQDIIKSNETKKENNDNCPRDSFSENDIEGIIKQHLHPAFLKIFENIEMKTICVINADTHILEKEKSAPCVKVSEVIKHKWYIEFSMLESYKIISISDDNTYYIIKNDFWKMLYNNIINKMSGNLMLPMSVEDLMNYEDSDESSS